MSETQRAKELAEAHWNGYVGPLLEAHNTPQDVVDIVAFHYISASMHGHKHGVEDERNGLFRPRIGEVTQYAPAHPYLHKDELPDYTPLSPSEVKEIAESVAPPVLGDNFGCDLSDLQPTSDEWETKDLCRRCGNRRCPMAGRTGATTNCVNYVGMVDLDGPEEKAPAPLSLPDDKPTGAAFGFNFPAAEKFMGYLKSDYVVKLRSEVQEVSDAILPKDAAIELMDVIHVAETALRSLTKDYALDLDDLADHVVAKNRQRGYYTR